MNLNRILAVQLGRISRDSAMMMQKLIAWIDDSQEVRLERMMNERILTRQPIDNTREYQNRRWGTRIDRNISRPGHWNGRDPRSIQY